MSKRNVLILFGGSSSLADISRRSAASIIESLDKERFSVTSIGITSDGRWLATPSLPQSIIDGSWERLQFNRPCTISYDSSSKGLVIFSDENFSIVDIDCVFETMPDFRISGLLEAAGIAHTGCPFSSLINASNTMSARVFCTSAGLNVPRSILIDKQIFASAPQEVTGRVMSYFDGKFPLIISANQAGHTFLFKAYDEASLAAYTALAATYCDKILVDYCEKDFKFFELAVIGNNSPIASFPAEIIISSDNSGNVSYTILKKTDKILSQKLSEACRAAFTACSMRGMATVRFIISSDNNVLFHSINPAPSFAKDDIYSKLFSYMGISHQKLISFITDLAFDSDEYSFSYGRDNNL